MRVKDGDNYILVGSQGGAPKDLAWAHNLRVNPHIELRDETIVRPMRVREVKDAVDRGGIPAVCGLSGAHRTSNSGLCRRTVIHPISVSQLNELSRAVLSLARWCRMRSNEATPFFIVGDSFAVRQRSHVGTGEVRCNMCE